MNEPIDMEYRWKSERERCAFLALADGTVFRGYSVGAPVDKPGEVVFNTGMTGYQEIVTDPSYAGQIVTLTSPEIGNYGCTEQDAESRGCFLNGLVVHELNPPANFRSEEALGTYLLRHGIPAIAGVDTRALTLHLRSHGTQRAYLHVSEIPMDEATAIEHAAAWEGLDGQDYASRVTTPAAYEINPQGKYRIVAYDFGIKYNILRSLQRHDMQVLVVPAHTSAAEVLRMRPDGVFLSNGPADPSALGYAQQTVRELLGRVPIMGICLGHQLLGLACGATCHRLTFGHHGCNHPVLNIQSGQVDITSQNHNFALRDLPSCLELTHINLNDNSIEGIRHRTEPAFSVQFHPEAAPGPHDAGTLFRTFRTLIENS